MGSVVSSAYAALCSFAVALLDKADMWWLMATDPYIRSLTAEEREKKRQWYRELDREPEHQSRNIRNWGRCNYRHPCYRDKDDNRKYEELSRDLWGK